MPKKWSKKYKRSIDCNNPKGFSQKAHCAGRKKKENVMSSKLEELVGKPITEEQFDEAAGKKDACYYKVKARYDVWPSAYASGALVKCRKVGAKNWGNSKKEGVNEKVLGGKDITSGIDKNTKITFDKRIPNKKLAGKTFYVSKKGINTFNVLPVGSYNEKDTKTLDSPTILKLLKNKTISKIVNSKGKAIHEQMELNKLKDAIKMFQKKIEKQGRVTNARDEEHLSNLIKLYKQMGGKGVKEGLDDLKALPKDLKKSIKKNREEGVIKENPAAIAAAQRMVVQNKSGNKISVNTARQSSYAQKDPSTHKKAKSLFQRIKDKFKKKESVDEARGTCWVGYQQKGMKEKNGRMVPNCVKEIIEIFYEENGEGHGYTFEYIKENNLNEAEYQGRKVKLGKIMQGDVKKFKVYVKNPKGNVVKVNFGQGGDAKGGTMRIRKSNPKARANFRARHNCDNPGPRHKARYWSCRKW